MKLNLILCFLLTHLTCSMAFAQPAYWCDAGWPPPAGSDRTKGKDSDGNVCIKISHPPEAVKPKTGEMADKEPIAQPAKDLLGKTGNGEGIAVTLSTNAEGEPVLRASCPPAGFSEWDYKALMAGYRQKVVKRGEQVFIIYEK